MGAAPIKGTETILVSFSKKQGRDVSLSLFGFSLFPSLVLLRGDIWKRKLLKAAILDTQFIPAPWLSLRRKQSEIAYLISFQPPPSL